MSVRAEIQNTPIVPDKDDSIPTGIHPTARVGGEPEMRTWRKGQRTLPPQIHETARISAFATVDAGLYMHTKIGKRSWIFQHAHIGHDCSIGMNVEVSTGAVVGGHCIVLDGVRIGINATILPHTTIGENARVGAGAVVTKRVPDGAIARGNPARFFDQQGNEIR